MTKKKHGRVWLEINLDTLCENYKKIEQAVAPCSVTAVLKANAYGLGVDRIAQALADAGASAFGVAELNEALSLQNIGKPVQILGSILSEEIPAAVDVGTILPITDIHVARLISAEAKKQNKITECHFLIDTGMGRLGILLSEAFNTVKESVQLPGLKCSGIYSHFPMAYKEGSEYTLNQLQSFLTLLEHLQKTGIVFDKIHIANSDAVNNFPVACKAPFNCVRTGINIHGSFDTEGKRMLDLKPVLTLKTRLVAMRILPAGTSIGYGCTCTLPKEMKVGTISAGYADGLPLSLSNRGYVLIKNKPCEILGRVSMDYTTVSLENVPDADFGDEVICLGGEGYNAIRVEDWAEIKGTHSYDIICSFGSRVKRMGIVDG